MVWVDWSEAKGIFWGCPHKQTHLVAIAIWYNMIWYGCDTEIKLSGSNWSLLNRNVKIYPTINIPKMWLNTMTLAFGCIFQVTVILCHFFCVCLNKSLSLWIILLVLLFTEGFLLNITDATSQRVHLCYTYFGLWNFRLWKENELYMPTIKERTHTIYELVLRNE